jgi:ribosome-associated protein
MRRTGTIVHPDRSTPGRGVTRLRGGPCKAGGTLPAPAPAPDQAGAFDRVQALHELVLRSLDDDQAQDVVSIPLTGKSNIADHMVIASGRSTRQVASMAQKLTQRIKQDLGRNVRLEGLPVADWVLIDAEDVIVHLFRPEVRSFYNLERMWAFEENAAAASPGA